MARRFETRKRCKKKEDKGLSSAVVVIFLLLIGFIAFILVYNASRSLSAKTTVSTNKSGTYFIQQMGSNARIYPTPTPEPTPTPKPTPAPDHRSLGGLFVPGTNELATIDGQPATWTVIMAKYPDAFADNGKTIKRGFPTTLEGELVVPIGVTSIGSYAFDNCTGLTSVTIPDSVKSIGNGTFCGCTGLTSITIPDSVKSINSFAFLRCTGLTSITIPDSVKSIGDYAFVTCTALTKINFNGTKEQWNAIPKGQDWHYVVPATCKVVCTDGEIAI